GLVEIGHHGDCFAFDNESPRHLHHLRPYALANRLVTHGEWAEFIADGGYREPRWWLSAGWEWVRKQQVRAPLYWQREGDHGPWLCFTLHGLVPIDPHTPIAHVSYFEADAFARWAGTQREAWRGARLSSEFEWEHAARGLPSTVAGSGNFVESQALHPMPVARAGTSLPAQMFGDVWEWTSSSYAPYPGFQPLDGAVGEYNGKFMVNQYVLRGGSCATPRSHIRASYRNFFPTDARWQFSGVRLARDME
ncbi:MAG TPA: SUMF1/EgtB/PvdO family nonheme iron enzyme, partial [Burkholderiaceae bacterium]